MANLVGNQSERSKICSLPIRERERYHVTNLHKNGHMTSWGKEHAPKIPTLIPRTNQRAAYASRDPMGKKNRHTQKFDPEFRIGLMDKSRDEPK